MRRRRSPEIISGRVNADGSIASGDGFTVQKGTAGLFTLTFAAGFRLTSIVTVSAASGVGRGTDAFPLGDRSATVTTFTMTTSALTDYPFCFNAVGA